MSPVSELDLDAIKAAAEELADNRCPDSVWTQRAVRVASLVPRLVAELERMQRLLAAPFPSSGAYESAVQALTDERAERDRLRELLLERSKEREDLRGLLAEILGHFLPAAPSTAGYALRSEPVPPETLDRWRSRLGGVS